MRPARDYRSVAALSHLPISFAVILGGGFFLGLKADEWLELKQPICALLGVMLGFACGFLYLWVSLFGRKEPPGPGGPGDEGTETTQSSES